MRRHARVLRRLIAAIRSVALFGEASAELAATASPARIGHNHVGRGVEPLESRMLLAGLPLPLIGDVQNLTATNGNDSSPSIAYDPVNTNKIVVVYASGGQVAGQYSGDGGASWLDLTDLTGAGQEVAVEFDRNENFFIAWRTDTDIKAQTFSFTADAPASAGAAVTIDAGGAPRDIALAVNSNLPTFTDPETGKTFVDAQNKPITDTNTGRIYVAWSVDGAGIQLAASKDVGKTWAGPVVVSDSPTASSPQVVVSQGSLDGRVGPGQVNIVWNDFGTNNLMFDWLDIGTKGDFGSGRITGTGAAVKDATAGANGPPDTPVITDLTANLAPGNAQLKLTDVDVSINLNHPNLEHVSVTLTAPGGVVIPLMKNKRDESNQDINPAQGIGDTGTQLNVTFDAQAANSILGAAGPQFTGRWQPEDLAAFNSLLGRTGTQLAGGWKLTVTDYVAETGNPPTQRVVNWSVKLTFGLTTNTDVVIGGGVIPGAVAAPYPLTIPALPQTGVSGAPSLASDNTLGSFSPYQGRLYVAYTGSQGGAADDTGVFLATSDDGGKTWTLTGVPINDDAATDGFSEGTRSQFGASIAVDQSTGALVATWYDARYDASRARVARFITSSVDGGETFGPQTYLNTPNTVVNAVTSQAVELGPIPDNQSAGNPQSDAQNGFGDHQDVAVIDGKVFPVWAGNQNEGSLDIYLAPSTISGGPRIVSGTMGPVGLPGDDLNPAAADGSPVLQSLEIEFDRPVDPLAVSRRALSVIYRDAQTSGNDPGEKLAIGSIEALDAGTFGPAQVSGATRFLVTLLEPQTRVGTYSYMFAPIVGDRIRKADAKVTANAPTLYSASGSQINQAVPPSGTGGSGEFISDTTVSMLTIAGVPQNEVISDLYVKVKLTHPDVSDLTLLLIAPDGTPTILAANVGFEGSANFTNTIFSDTATTLIEDGAAPFTGSFKPQMDLSSLKGISANGDWTLAIADDVAGDAGTLDSWSLTIATRTATGLGNLMDQDVDGIGGESGAPADFGDIYAMPGPGAQTGYTGEYLTPPFDSDTLPLIVPGPRIIESHAVVQLDASATRSQSNLPIPAGEASPETASIINIDNVSPLAAILNMDVTVWIDHQKDSDLVIQLTSPEGVTVVLSNQNGGDGPGYMGTIFDDGAEAPIATGIAPFLGRFQPDEPLSAFTGVPLFGEWTLTVIDPTPEDTGELWGWSIHAEITSGQEPALNQPVGMIDVVFDRPMDPSSFTGASILRMVTPAGTITPAPDTMTITPDPLGMDPNPDAPQTYRISFPPQQLSGTYSLTLASNIRSAAGDALDMNLNAGLDLLRDTSVATTKVTAPSTDLPKIIGSTAVSGTETTSTINITESHAILGLQVMLDITYANDPDLEAWLIAPDGTTEVKLFGNVGKTGTRANFSNTTFDDGDFEENDPPVTPIQNGGAPFFGRFSPEQALGQLMGMNVQGTWTLRIKVNGTRIGTLRNWSISYKKAVPSSGLGEAIADQAALSFSIFTQDPRNPLSHSTWTSIGPTSYGGRVSALAVDPSDPSGNTVYVGAASGGVWKTTNFLTTDPSGPTYVPLTDFGPVGGMSVGGIAVFPRNNDPKQTIIFAAMGEGDSDTPGQGFLRSMDGGASWTVLDSTVNTDALGNILPMNSGQRDHILSGTSAYKVVVDPRPTPSGDVIVYAALSGAQGRGGVWRSLDTGKTWRNMSAGLNGGNLATDVVLDPNSGYIDAFNTTGNLQVIYAGFEGLGVYRSPNRGQVWNLMAGGVGNPHIRDTQPSTPQPIPVTAPPSTPNGAKGRIVLAKPEFTGVALQDLLYQGWLYAAVATENPGLGGTLDGLYVTKDYGQNWTQIRVPSLAGAPDERHPAYPTNDTAAADYDPTAGGEFGAGAGRANFALSLAIDPNNPNVVYLGGNSRTRGPAVIRVDTTGLSDPHAFFRADDRADGGQVRSGATDPVTPANGTPTATSYASATTPYMNLIVDPNQPFQANATIFVHDISNFANTGSGSKWVTVAEGLFGANVIPDTAPEMKHHYLHRIVTLRDPITGKTRLIFGDEQGVYTQVDPGDGSNMVQLGTIALPDVNRNGNLAIAQFIQGAAQPSIDAATSAGALFYGTTQYNGIRGTSADVLGSGYLGDRYLPEGGGTGGIATNQQGNNDLYFTRWPADLYSAGDFFLIGDLQAQEVGRTFGLLQSTQGGAKSGDDQWPDNWGSNFAVNPIDGNQIIISSSTGRIFGTENGGLYWSVIGDPAALDGSYARALAYGAPDPRGPGGVDATNFLLYAGTDSGNIYVTFNGGGGAGNNWIDISAGLDGWPVQAIITNPTRGSHEAYAVTEGGVFRMLDSAAAGARWVNITGNLGSITTPLFGDPQLAVPKVTSLSSVVADWRYVIPDNVTKPDGPSHPMLYVAGDAGVYRSMDLGKTWRAFPDVDTDGAPVAGGYLPNVQVSDLDLSIGYIDPTNGRAIGSSGPNVLLASTYGRGFYAIRLAPAIVGSIALNQADDVGKSPTDRLTNVTTPRFSGFSQQTAFGNNVKITLLDISDPQKPVIIGGYDPDDPATDIPANYTDATGRFEVAVHAGAFYIDGKHRIAARATDDAGTVGQMVDGGEITVDLTQPEITLADFAAREQTAITGTIATFTDYSPGCTATVNWGNGPKTAQVVPNAGGGFDVRSTNTYAQAGTYPFSVTVIDPAGNTAVLNADIVVTEAAVAGVGGFIVNAVEGQAFTDQLLATFTDPTGTEPIDQYSATIDWGDGTSSEGTLVLNGNDFSVLGGHQYDDSGNYDVTVTIHHANGPDMPVVSSVAVANPAMVVSGVPGFTAIESVDSAVQRVATFTDPGGPEALNQYTAQIDWGDGTPPTDGVISFDADTKVFTVSGTHRYDEPGTFTVTTTVRQGDAPDASASTEANVSDPAVIGTGGFAITAVEGALSDLQVVATFTDPAGPDPLSDYSARIAWNDGTATDGIITFDEENGVFTVSGAYAYADPGDYAVVVMIRHQLAEDVYVQSSAAVANPAIIATGGLAVTAGEGAAFTQQTVATFTDPGGAEAVSSYSAEIDWGDQTTSAGTIVFNAGVFEVKGDHTYAAKGDYTITVTARHAETEAQVVTSSATVLEKPADIAVSPIVSGIGGFDGVVATFTDDSGATADQFTATIDWGDGTPQVAGVVTPGSTAGTFNVLGSHDYGDGPGNFTITVTVTRPGAMPGVAQIPVTVENAAPTATVSGPTSGLVGLPMTFTVGATDPAQGDQDAGFTYTIDWGDGSAAETIPAAAGNGAGVQPTHTFTVPGSYTVKVTAADRDGATHTAEATFTANALPTLKSVIINNKVKQRSHIDLITFKISSVSPLPAITKSNLRLLRNGRVVVKLNRAGFTFNAATGACTLDLRKVALADGDYQLQIETFFDTWLAMEFIKRTADADGNGLVNAVDQKIVQKAMGTKLGQRKFNPAADLDNNSKVDAKDLALVKKYLSPAPAAVPTTMSLTPGQSVRAGTINFGRVTLKTTRAIDLVIRNASTTEALTIQNLAIAGVTPYSSAVRGSLWTEPAGAFTVAPGKTRVVRVYITATKAGAIRGTMSFQYSADGVTWLTGKVALRATAAR